MRNKRYDILLAWVVSIIATAGSLYFSEVKDFIPCELCWYQRILMYPLVVILGISLFQQKPKMLRYILPFSIAGVLLSTYHYLIQKTTIFGGGFSCSAGVPCTGEYINWFGFVTIPFLAMTAFALVSFTLWVYHMLKKPE